MKEVGCCRDEFPPSAAKTAACRGASALFPDFFLLRSPTQYSNRQHSTPIANTAGEQSRMLSQSGTFFKRADIQTDHDKGGTNVARILLTLLHPPAQLLPPNTLLRSPTQYSGRQHSRGTSVMKGNSYSLEERRKFHDSF